MGKIEKLTPEQEAQVVALRERFFAQATSTEPADRARAEAAARRLAEIGGVKINAVVWAKSAQDGQREYEKAWDSLRASLWDSLGDSLGDSLWDSLRDSLRASLRASLGASLWDSLGDSGWTAFYAAGRDVIGVEYDPKYAEILRLHEEIGASCFALWIVPGAVILCERPSKCDVVDGRLVNIEWEE